MSEQIKAALVIAAGIVVATFVYTWTTAYFSPFETCLRRQKAADEQALKSTLERVAEDEEALERILKEIEDSPPGRSLSSRGTEARALRLRLTNDRNHINHLSSAKLVSWRSCSGYSR